MEKNVLIGCNGANPGSVSLCGKICSLLAAAGMTPCVCADDSDFADVLDVKVIDSIKECSYVVTVGGDGTIIKWGKLAAVYGIPLLGVNMGRLGFMATLEPSEIERIPTLLHSCSRRSRRMLMECRIFRDGKELLNGLALNDVVISRDITSKLPEFDIFCERGDIVNEVSKLRADGVILSTPTGSTAYSLSAGGPILAPELQCIELTALCPHTLFNRPMIFSAEQRVFVKLRSYHNSRVSVSIDGVGGIAFSEGDELWLSKSEHTLELLEAGDGFYGAVNNKLMTPLK